MAVLAGEAWDVRVPGSDEVAGTARFSASGRANNITIAPFSSTTPVQSVLRMLAGEQRKAPLSVRGEQVEG